MSIDRRSHSLRHIKIIKIRRRVVLVHENNYIRLFMPKIFPNNILIAIN